MSVRGNIFLVQRGSLTITFDKWVAEYMPSFLHGGPSWAIERALDFKIEDAPLDETWSEGAALIDMDARRLRFFGGGAFGHQPWSRRVALALLKAAWRGWDVGLCHEGQTGILRMLGHPDAEAAAGEDDALARTSRIRTVTSASEANVIVWISGRGPVGLHIEREDWRSPTTIDVALTSHTLGLDRLLHGDVLRSPKAPIERRLCSGAWIDAETKAIRIWDQRTQPRVRGRVSEALPGWSVEWQDGGLDGMLRRACADPEPWVVPVGEAIDEAWPKIDASYPHDFGMRRVAHHLVRDGYAPVALLTRATLCPADVKPWLANAIADTKIWKA